MALQPAVLPIDLIDLAGENFSNVRCGAATLVTLARLEPPNAGLMRAGSMRVTPHGELRL